MFDPDTVAAIDIHTHAEEPCGTHADDGYEEFQAGMQKYFRTGRDWPPAIPETAAYFRERNIGAVIFAVDCERETGFPPLQQRADRRGGGQAFRHPDPLRQHRSGQGQDGRKREARRLVEQFGMRGFKFHPTMQGFYPERPQRLCALRGDRRGRRAGPVPHRPDRGRRRHAGRHGHAAEIFQSDVSGRRGGGFPGNDHRPRSSRPSRGRRRRSRSRTTSRTSISTSRAGRRNISRRSWCRYANTLLRHKVLFGSDWPAITPDRWLADFATLDIKEEVKPLILKENARKVLGI